MAAAATPAAATHPVRVIMLRPVACADHKRGLNTFRYARTMEATDRAYYLLLLEPLQFI